MNTLNDLITRSQQYDLAKEDYTVGNDRIGYGADRDGFRILFPGGLFGTVSSAVTDHALTQICSKLKTPPTKYMRACPPQLRANNLNHWQRDADQANWFLRTDGNAVRGVLSEHYVPLGNSEVLETVGEILQKDGIINYRLVRPHVDADRLWVRVLLRDHVGDNYGIGIVVGNDEIGRGSCKVLPFVQRHSCTNSTVWQEGGYEQRHIGRNARTAMRVRMKGAILDGLKASATMYEQVLQAEEEKLPSIADYINSLASEHRWSDHVRDTVLIGTEGERTLMGVVNGLSFAAHAAEETTDDVRHMLELLSGKVLMRDYAQRQGAF